MSHWGGSKIWKMRAHSVGIVSRDQGRRDRDSASLDIDTATLHKRNACENPIRAIGTLQGLSGTHQL